MVFVPVSVLMALANGGVDLGDCQVITYHHRPDDPVPDKMGRIMSKPGLSITLSKETGSRWITKGCARRVAELKMPHELPGFVNVRLAGDPDC